MKEWICEFLTYPRERQWHPFCTNWSQPIYEHYHGKDTKYGAGPHPPMEPEDIETCVMFIRDSIGEWKEEVPTWDYKPEEFRIRHVKTNEIIPASALGI